PLALRGRTTGHRGHAAALALPDPATRWGLPAPLRHLTRRSSGRSKVSAMRTRLTEILDIEHPVMLAGMGGVSYSALVTAVSEAGGFGCLGASTMGDEQMVEEIAA